MKTIASTLLLLICLPTLLFGQSIEEDDFFDPAFVFEMVDPGFCEMPPANVTDRDISEMLRANYDQVPIKGNITGPISGEVLGGGYYNSFSDGVVASFNNLILLPDDEILSLCLVVVPAGDTVLTEGSAMLAGPAPESIDGQTFLAIIQISEREGSELTPIGSLVGGTGSVTFAMKGDEYLEGSLEINGRIEGLSAEDELDFYLSFDFEEMIKNPLRMIRWSVDNQ